MQSAHSSMHLLEHGAAPLPKFPSSIIISIQNSIQFSLPSENSRRHITMEVPAAWAHSSHHHRIATAAPRMGGREREDKLKINYSFWKHNRRWCRWCRRYAMPLCGWQNMMKENVIVFIFHFARTHGHEQPPRRLPVWALTFRHRNKWPQNIAESPSASPPLP